MIGVFTRRVLGVVRRIPAGRVASYGQVAALAGQPRAARAVGNIMRAAAVPGLPYHRVVGAGGRLGGFGGQELLKRQRLMAEGIQFSGSRIRDFNSVCMAPSRAGRTRSASD
ncbi:MAG: MGMT family protein [Vicinamibacterales bacterium]